MIVIFSGSSGVGKNTVINELIAKGIGTLMPTFTTRAIRVGEKEGAPYYFVDKEKFESMIEKGEFYEYEFVHNKNYYGTHKKTVEKFSKEGGVLLKDIDVLGALNLKKVLDKDIKLFTIYLDIDKQTLKDRLVGRGETDIENRLARFDFELSYAKHYDLVINNVDLIETVNKCIEAIERAAR